MAINPFVGWSQADLELELRAAQEDLASGKTVMQVAGADVQAQKQVQLSILSRIELLLRALNAIDSTTYPVDEISRLDRTVVTFNS